MPAFAASRLVTGSFDEGVIHETAVQLREQLSGKPTFGLVFVSSDYADKATEVLELVRVYGHVPVLLGCSGTGLAGQSQELEEGSGFSLLLVSMPGGKATAVSFSQDDVEGSTGPDFWHAKTGIKPSEVKAWLAFLNPYVFNTETWLKQWNQAYPRVPIFGGRAGGVPGDPEAWVFCDDRVARGGVALALEGEIAVRAVVSQGCKPIGEPLTVTQAERNVLLTLGSRPAYEVLSDVYKDLSDAEREQARGHLFAGLAVSEYLEEYKRGDFLVRNIIGADPKSGAVAINALPRVGQTLQYQLRDSQAASDELRRLLREQAAAPASAPYAGLLCTCSGRGRGLFRRPNHDVGLINEFFPGLPLAGFSANVQIGPVGERSFEHSYTASLALLGPAVPTKKE
ncbi:MAG: FIST C-terminal domain-containing protein [Methylacidiphilales bacterium]|nr:FIST C-terminal domain-containing protein [Candidatus Methylacidiphilales bacterium]